MAEKKSYTYENTSGQDQVVVGVGEVKAGGKITANEPFTNPNFKLVTSKSAAAAKPGSKEK